MEKHTIFGISGLAFALILLAGCCGMAPSECPASCDDGNPCTDDACSGNTDYECANAPISGAQGGCSGNVAGQECMEYSCSRGTCGESAISGCTTANASGKTNITPKQNSTGTIHLNNQTRPSGAVVPTEVAQGTGKTSVASSLSSPAGAGAEWTIIVYMDGDTNLESAAMKDFNEMETAGSTDKVNIIVQLDRSPNSNPEEGYDSSNGDWDGTKRFYVLKDDDMGRIKSRELEDIGEANMGNGKTLEDFAVWAAQTYPAKKYALVIWDHGAGWDYMATGNGADGMVSFDDTSDGDGLTLREVQAAMAKLKNATGKKIELVGFDACLMGMYEVYYGLSDYAQVHVASEELEPGDGWDYAASLSALVKNPEMSSADLGKRIVQDYGAFYREVSRDDGVTLSAVDLSKIGGFTEKIDNFASVMAERMTPQAVAEISKARANAEEYGNYEYGSIDIVDFANIVSQVSTDPAIISAAKEVSDAYKESLISETHGEGKSHSYGYAAYFARTKEKYIPEYTQYAEFPTDTGWEKFLKAYYGLQGSDLTGPDVRNFTASAESASPSEPLTITAIASGNKISDVELIVYEEGNKSYGNYYILLNYVKLYPPSRELDDGSSVSEWADGENPISAEWNSYGLAVESDDAYVFAPLQEYEREGKYYYVNGEYRTLGSLDPVYASLVFDYESGALKYIWDNDRAKEIPAGEGDSFAPYVYIIDMDKNDSYYMPWTGLVYGESGFKMGYYPLNEGNYYLSVYAEDVAGASDSEGAFISVGDYAPSGSECNDGTLDGYCSYTYNGYACDNGQLEFSDSCYSPACSDGTEEGQCSMGYHGYMCANGQLEYEQSCSGDDYCSDWTPSGTCSETYNGYVCSAGEFAWDDSCYDSSLTDECEDGTMNGYCSIDSPGHYCYYGQLQYMQECEQGCSDGTPGGYCSSANIGYACFDASLEKNSECGIDYGSEESCSDGTRHGYCSIDNEGYWCDNGKLEYSESCLGGDYGDGCSDGTLDGYCSTLNPGYGCYGGELYEYEECGASISYDCSDGTKDGYCSIQYEGYGCSGGELSQYSACEGSCSDGSSNGYCSYDNEGYACFDGELSQSAFCAPSVEGGDCGDGTAHGYCSDSNSGYACWNGQLSQNDECNQTLSTAGSEYCSDGTKNLSCSTTYPGYYCYDGEYYEYDYCNNSCSDGTADGYCSSASEGYWCNAGEMQYDSSCDSGNSGGGTDCSDGTLDGYCSSITDGYGCWGGQLSYYEECANQGACSDGTASGYCSIASSGYYCWNGELTASNSCGGAGCSDGTPDGYCSSTRDGFYCDNGNLAYYDGCASGTSGKSCSDGTASGYCSQKMSGYYCNDGNLIDNRDYCLQGYGCSDGTANGYCSTSSPGKICKNGKLASVPECLNG